MDNINLYLVVANAGLFALLGSAVFWAIHYYRLRKLRKPKESESYLVTDLRGRQLYIDQSHILMAGFQWATECINCGGNSKTAADLKKLIVPCSMELSVYNGNNKFKEYTGESNV